MKLILKPNTFRYYASILVFVFFSLSFLSTTISILDEQYRMKHNNDLMYVKDQMTLADQSVVTNYGYRLNPFSIPAKIMAFAIVFVPIIAIVACSFVYLFRSAGNLKVRFWKAFGLSCLVFPLMFLELLPWSLYQGLQNPLFWQYDEFMIVVMIFPFFCGLIVFISLIFNTIAYWKLRKTIKVA